MGIIAEFFRKLPKDRFGIIGAFFKTVDAALKRIEALTMESECRLRRLDIVQTSLKRIEALTVESECRLRRIEAIQTLLKDASPIFQAGNSAVVSLKIRGDGLEVGDSSHDVAESLIGFTGKLTNCCFKLGQALRLCAARITAGADGQEYEAGQDKEQDLPLAKLDGSHCSPFFAIVSPSSNLP